MRLSPSMIKRVSQRGSDFKARVTDNDCEHLPFPGVAAKKRGEHQDSHVTTEGLRNPMVERAIFQVRRVVNRIIDEYGKPTTIRIEMARDMKNNALQRSDKKSTRQ